MSKVKKYLSLIVLIVFVLSIALSGCGQKPTDISQAEQPKETPKQQIPKEIKLSLPWSTTEILEPHVWTWGTIYGKMGIFEGLTKLDKDFKAVPANAKSWEHNADYTVWTFHLRDDLKWSDGTPLTAYDYEYSWKRAVNPATAAEYGKGTSFITGVPLLNAEEILRGEKDPDTLGVKALDEKTLEVRLAKPWPMMDVSAADPWAVPVPKHVIEKYGKEWVAQDKIVSNGPYKVKSYELGVNLVLEPNPYYYGKVNLDKVEVIKLESEILPYKNGDINVATANQADIEMIEKDPELKSQMQFYKTGVVYYMALMQSENDILQKNPKVRQAIAMSINKDIIANDIMKGTVRPGLSMVPEIFAPWGTEIGLKYNPEKARELMKEAGFPDGKGFPELTIMVAGNPGARELAIADMIEKGTGIKTKIVNYEWAKFVDERDNKIWPKDQIGYWISGAGTPVYHYSGYFRTIGVLGKELLSPEKYKEYLRIKDDKSIDPQKKSKMLTDFIEQNTTPEAKKYIELRKAGLDASDPAEQERILKEAGVLREELAVYIPIDWENAVKLMKPYIKGYVGDPIRLGAPPLYFNDITIQE
ncbi:MAG: peptide ABC transporter substrate-binding protein [Thermoanaerobacter sp.]|uniref:ABC-type dipeptide/oligopeptide/nickel transport system, periplasmic component n=1 Tax=Caldanaerobacter subterraneus subsp. pacificus DSM 12653 TaxID=391606 RepID=B7R6D1_9THEO|nr:peptide ABC transporter substrate-binding protein [Caldanaerobacter subterraneus]KKC28778.1 ABC-type dipeptide/oligopeptide/nickel transport system, periplasmic component [Caldanaerobacter subterraneus subsp. pacificus DSM 12653]MBE3593365.1 peptide ABC transporter substrate-binding protein [Thermoanaerobacter sp.]